MSFIAEYIWTGTNSTDIRSKVRVSNIINDWNCDGSSCGHGTVDNSVYVLKPVAYYGCEWYNKYIVLCDSTSRRYINNVPGIWIGFEQEYYISKNDTDVIYPHYCGQGLDPVDRAIVDEHLYQCLAMGLSIGGTNAEVGTGQWEFQIGPLGPLDACDQLIVARFMLMRIAEKYSRRIEFGPRPYAGDCGSGCHINVSTEQTRVCPEMTETLMPLLENRHSEFIAICGEKNLERLTGANETASYRTFTWGYGTRNTSIRINDGYFEDRRPGADVDPYLAVAHIISSL